MIIIVSILIDFLTDKAIVSFVFLCVCMMVWVRFSPDIGSKELHLAIHAEDTVHAQVFVVVGNGRLDKGSTENQNKNCNASILTYIFFGWTVVELVGLDAHMGRLLKLYLEHGLVSHGLVHLVLLGVAVHSCSSLAKLTILERNELLLVVEAVADVGVVMAGILHDLVQVVLVIDLWSALVGFWAEGRVFLEDLLTLFNISDDFFGLEDGDSALGYIELKCWPGLTHRRVAHARPTIWLVGGFRRDIEGKTTLLWRNRVKSAIVVITHLLEVRHCLCV